MSVSVDIRKDFGKFRLDVAFEAKDEIHALLGASGCGKSMTLKCIAGIVKPDEGRIVVDGVTLFDSVHNVNLSPQKRRVGLLFQHYALFPNMTVAQNISCGMNALPKADRPQRLKALIDMMVLHGLEHRYPSQLSGGQQQRAALARILASDPKAIMLDEPFSALDSHLRWQLEREVGAVLRRFAGTTLLVSHSRDEVYRLSDSITVLSEGRRSIGDEKQALFDRPRTLSAALLTGCKNIAATTKTGPHAMNVPQWNLTLTSREEVPDDVRYVGLRAHYLTPCDRQIGENRFCYRVAEHIEDTFSHILMVTVAGGSGQSAIRWELSKERYQTLPDKRSGCLYIPPACVHPLVEP